MCGEPSVRSSDYYDLCREHRELQDVTSHGFQTFVGKTVPCKTKSNEKWKINKKKTNYNNTINNNSKNSDSDNSNKNDNDNNIKDINNDNNNNPSPAIKTKGGPKMEQEILIPEPPKPLTLLEMSREVGDLDVVKSLYMQS